MPYLPRPLTSKYPQAPQINANLSNWQVAIQGFCMEIKHAHTWLLLNTGVEVFVLHVTDLSLISGVSLITCISTLSTAGYGALPSPPTTCQKIKAKKHTEDTEKGMIILHWRYFENEKYLLWKLLT